MRTKKTEEERIASIEAELARLQKQKNKIAAAKRAKDTALEKRRAFLVGEAVLAAKTSSGLPDYFLETLAVVLDDAVKGEGDRKAISDLLPSAPAFRRPAAMGA